MPHRNFDAREETLANVMRDVCDNRLSENTLGRVNALLEKIRHIDFPIRVVRYAGMLGLMFDVEYYYLDNEDDIPRERVMDWWLNECDHNTLTFEPTRLVVETFVKNRYTSLKDRFNKADNGIRAFFTTSESFVEFRVFVPSQDALSKPSIVNGVHDELVSLYSY